MNESGGRPNGSRARGGAACLIAVLLAVGFSGLAVAAEVPQPTLPTEGKAIAVMYFENRSAGGDWQWLSTGIADMLITDLGRSERLVVVEREHLAAMLQELRLVEGGLIDPANAAKVGQVTKVDWVLFGSFEKKGDTLNIEGHILEVKSGQLLRVEQVEGKAEEVQALEKQLAEQLLTRLDMPLTEGERQSLLARKPTDSLDALTHYYQGVEAYELGDYHRALAEFHLAARQDPAYLEARVQAAEMYSRIEELQHALAEYRRLTDPDRDKVLPDFVHYGLGRLLEIRFRDYEAALAAYRIITDRRLEFSYNPEELKRVVEDLNERARKARASDESWGLLSAYADEQRKASKEFALPCLAMMREAMCYEALHQDMQAARTYLLLDGFLRVRHIYNPVPGFMDARGAQWYGVGSKAAEWYQWAVEHNRDTELPTPPNISAAPADGQAVEVKFGASEGWGGPLGARTYIAPPDREIASLSLATTPAGELANPTPASAKWYYREAEVRVYGVGAADLLMRYSYPVGGRSENRSVKAQGVSVTQSPGTSGGRDYRVDMPPGIRGVSVAASLADWRVQFTTRPWQGPSVPQKREQIASAWSASLPVSARISVHPTGMSNLFLDGTLVYDAESFTFDRWSRAPKGFLSLGSLNASCFIHGDKDLDEHTVVAVWPDGQVAERSWTASAGEAASIVLNATGASPERHKVAASGSSPSLFRDRRGIYWLVWVGSDKAPAEASATAGARSPAAETEPPGKKGIYCCFSPDGRIWSVPRRLSVSSPEDDWGPAIRQDSQGTYWLLWVSNRDPSDPRALWLASSLDGQRWTYPRKLKLPVPKDTDWLQWYGGCGLFVDPRGRFWAGGSRRLTYSDDMLHWAEPMEIDALGYGSGHSLSCDLAGRLLLVAEDVVGASNPRPPLLYASKDGAQWTKVAELDGGFQPDKEAKLGPKDEEFFGTIQRTCCGVRVIQNSDGMFLMRFSRGSFGGGPLYVGWSRDGRTWGEPLLVEPPLKEGTGGRSESTIAPGGPGRCVVAIATDEGIFSLLCQLPYATAGQEVALHPPITGALEAGATEKSAQPTILVLPFRGEEKGEQGALGEALAEVLTIDLARQEGVSVVDRSHLASVLQEQKLSLSGLVDQAAQLRVGKLLGAKLLLAGSFVLTPSKLTVTAHLFDVSTTQLVKSEEVPGEVSDWLGVEKALALALVKDLEVEVDEVVLRAIDEKPEVNLHFIRGLGYYYANRPDEAIMEFLNTLFGDEKYVDARYWMARSYLATGEPEHARLEFERIVKEYPQHPLASESRRLLGTLPVAAQGSTDEKKPCRERGMAPEGAEGPSSRQAWLRPQGYGRAAAASALPRAPLGAARGPQKACRTANAGHNRPTGGPRRSRAESRRRNPGLERKDVLVPVTDSLSVIAIGAHMDDCWLGAGATCLKAARHGHRVTFVTAVSSYRYFSPVRGREAELHPQLQELCRANGIGHILLGHDYLRLVNTPALVDEIAQVLRTLSGDILFCHAEDEDNQDHTALGAASRIAALHGECFTDTGSGVPWPGEVYQYTTGWQAKAFHPDTFVDVTDTLLDALAICNSFDEIYAHGRSRTGRLTITDHTQGDRTLSLTDHTRFKFAQSIAFGTGCYAEGFVAYGRRCLERRKLVRI